MTNSNDSYSQPLMEHQGVDRTQSGVDDTPQDDKDLIRKCEALLQKSKKIKHKVDYCWIDYYKMFRGRQWKEERPSYRASEVINIIWQAIQSSVPIIMDVRPKFEYLPQEPADREFADLMNELASADWEQNNWGFVLTEVVYDSHIYGTGLSCLKYDSSSQKIIYHSTDPFYLFPDPMAESFQRRCAWVHHVEPYDVERLKRLNPDKADKIKADVVNFASEKRVDLTTNKYNSPSSDQLYVEVSGGYDTHTVPEVLLKTVYFEDEEVLLEEVEGENGEKTKVRRLKYPNGRKVIYCNEVVLEDGPNDYEDESRYPYQRLINYILPRSFWGISELEPLESMQRTFNKMVSTVLDVLYLTGNPIWVVDTTAGVDTRGLTNQPGLVVEKEPGSDVRRESGVQLQPYVLSMIDRLKDWFDQMSGSQDITRGITPGAVTAASAIADLQNAAQTRIRLKSKNLDAYLQDFGQQYAARVMQFYDAPRVFRITGKDGARKYFKMHIETMEDGTKKAYVQRYTENALLDPIPQEYQLRGKLDVRVVTGSSLPFSKRENEQQALSLFDRGIIDAEEVLKRLEYPNYEAVLERRQQAQLAEQQGMAAAPQTA